MMASWDWPQWTMAVLVVLSFAGALSTHGKTRTYNAGMTFLSIVIEVVLLTAGGFWS